MMMMISHIIQHKATSFYSKNGFGVANKQIITRNNQLTSFYWKMVISFSLSFSLLLLDH